MSNCLEFIYELVYSTSAPILLSGEAGCLDYLPDCSAFHVQAEGWGRGAGGGIRKVIHLKCDITTSTFHNSRKQYIKTGRKSIYHSLHQQ